MAKRKARKKAKKLTVLKDPLFEIAFDADKWARHIRETYGLDGAPQAVVARLKELNTSGAIKFVPEQLILEITGMLMRLYSAPDGSQGTRFGNSRREINPLVAALKRRINYIATRTLNTARQKGVG